MPKIKKTTWEMVVHNILGYHIYDAQGQCGHHSYFSLVYDLAETDNKGGFRTRTVFGNPVYLHEHPQLALALKVCSQSTAELMNTAVRGDKEWLSSLRSSKRMSSKSSSRRKTAKKG